MIKKLLASALFTIFSVVIATAQLPCVFDKEQNCIAKGKTKSIKQKTSFGSKYNVSLRTGDWVFMDIEGTKVMSGNYIIKKNFSMKNGIWNYYSDEGVLLMKRTYKNDLIIETTPIDTGIHIYQNDTIKILNDGLGGLKITEIKGTLRYEYQGLTNTSLVGKPEAFAVVYKKEQSLKTQNVLTDEEIIVQFPKIKSLINIPIWNVNSDKNLIQNGNFEMEDIDDHIKNYTSSQIKPIQEERAKYWSSANETPDFHKLNDNCFGGFRVFGVNYEVLRNELKTPLKVGQKYCFQFKIKLKNTNHFSVNGVSVLISKNYENFVNREDGIKHGVVFQTHPEITLACREDWMIISGQFTAIGGEKYLYIGNFSLKEDFKLTKIDATASEYAEEIYYYIDDVVLIENIKEFNCPCNTRGCDLKIDSTLIPKTTLIPNPSVFENPKVGQTIVLKNIQFETSKWDLLPASYNVLDSLYELLMRFPNMQIEINGHTDDKGNKEKNQILSFNRANSVMLFLIDQGIEEHRLEAKGYGQEIPIDDNSTESGRFNNRRVEFKIIKI